MSSVISDDQWYAVSTAELATTLAHADARMRMARESLDAVHQDMSRTIVALGDVEIEVRSVARPLVESASLGRQPG